MRVTFAFDSGEDYAYLQLGESRSVLAAVEVPGAPDISLDFDEDGRLAGLEFTEARRRLGFGVLDDLLADAIDEEGDTHLEEA